MIFYVWAGIIKVAWRINITKTVDLLKSLGFIINVKKSCLLPNTFCKYLGFIINSKAFTVELPNEKRLRLLTMTQKIARQATNKIREFAQLIGSLVACCCCPAMQYGWLYCKQLERQIANRLIAKQRQL